MSQSEKIERSRTIPKREPDKTADLRGGYKIRYYDKGHTYWIVGGNKITGPVFPSWTWLPSITQITPYAAGPPDGLVAWAVNKAVLAFTDLLLKHEDIPSGKRLKRLEALAKKAPNADRDAAGDHGNMVHDLFERMAHGRKMPRTPRAQAMDRFWRRLKLRTEGAEIVLASPEKGCAGTIDWYGTGILPAERCPPEMRHLSQRRSRLLLDYKTSNYVLKKHWAQVGGYELMLERQGMAVDGAAIVHWPQSEREPSIYVQLAPDMDKLAFEAALFNNMWHNNQHLPEEARQWLESQRTSKQAAGGGVSKRSRSSSKTGVPTRNSSTSIGSTRRSTSSRGTTSRGRRRS